MPRPKGLRFGAPSASFPSEGSQNAPPKTALQGLGELSPVFEICTDGGECPEQRLLHHSVSFQSSGWRDPGSVSIAA